ncbi:lysophospholipid acyltransferase family protein [Coralliovum pocilloporae]|uniref:lysophospholipid acyltransferase family protein n=1 Tax=Coralliovum pocilloporae TaxID=3066369 RepID=UPI003307842A
MAKARAVFSLVALALFLIPGLPLQWICVRFKLPPARLIPNLFHRYVCAAIGVRIHIEGAPTGKRPLLITSNHLSWLDIPVLSAVMPLSFVAKSDVAGWPIIGTFARLQRSIFVERTRRSATGKAASQMADRLSDGDPIVLFPEGTSSDGNYTLPFKSALIGATEKVIAGASDHSDVLIQPVSIAYTRLDGLPMTRRDRPATAWYGDMDLGPHLWDILKGGAVDVTVSFGDPVSIHDFANRKVMAKHLEDTVRQMTVRATLGRPDAE